jgi:hypothetical protein
MVKILRIYIWNSLNSLKLKKTIWKIGSLLDFIWSKFMMVFIKLNEVFYYFKNLAYMYDICLSIEFCIFILFKLIELILI